MGWGRASILRTTKYIRVEEHPTCEYCANPATHQCAERRRHYSCDRHIATCCVRVEFRVSEVNRTPLMELGTWVYVNGHSIARAPEHLLVAAWTHIEGRIGRCKTNARGRAQQQWLGKWARMIDRELSRR